MPFKLAEVSTDAEIAALAAAEFDAYETPDCKLKQLFFPVVGDDSAAREAAIADAVKRQTLWHHADPSSTWIHVLDEDTGRVAGAACWHIYDADPYATTSDDECDWWPEGEDRTVANGLMGQFLTPRATYMRKTHACKYWSCLGGVNVADVVVLDICFTHPDYRRQAVGSMLVNWGLQRADEKGLDAYIDATDIGMELYRKHGFVPGERREFTVQSFPATKRRDELEAQLVPFRWWPALRPAGGAYEAGKGLLPWEE